MDTCDVGFSLVNYMWPTINKTAMFLRGGRETEPLAFPLPPQMGRRRMAQNDFRLHGKTAAVRRRLQVSERACLRVNGRPAYE